MSSTPAPPAGGSEEEEREPAAAAEQRAAAAAARAALVHAQRRMHEATLAMRLALTRVAQADTACRGCRLLRARADAAGAGPAFGALVAAVLSLTPPRAHPRRRWLGRGRRGVGRARCACCGVVFCSWCARAGLREPAPGAAAATSDDDDDGGGGGGARPPAWRQYAGEASASFLCDQCRAAGADAVHAACHVFAAPAASVLADGGGADFPGASRSAAWVPPPACPAPPPAPTT
jgi:hypothetical protein